MIWVLVTAIVVVTVMNVTTLHDPELAGVILLAAIIAVTYVGAAYRNRTNH